jgi:tetratricopeptide (TPR) repeat protein
MIQASLRSPALMFLLAAGAGPMSALGQGPRPVADAAQSPSALEVATSRTTAEFQADGTGTRDFEIVVKVLQDSGLKSLSVLVFGYSGEAETVTVDYIRVRKADGSLVLTPPENVQDVAPASAGGFPVYSDAREKHVAVKGLAVGDTLEGHVQWRLLKPAMPGQFSLYVDTGTTEIIKEKIDQVRFPADLAYKVANHGPAPEITVQDGRRTLRWVQSNLVPRVPAARAPWAGKPVPQAMVSSLTSWEEVGAWYHGLASPQEETTPAIKAKAKELTAGLAGDRDRVRALYAFVSTQIHYVGLSFGQGRYRPHAAGEVLANGYGDCKDKHTLLASLLKASGLEAWPALMRASGDLEREVPTPNQFDHVVTVVPLGAEWLWLDATPEVAPFRYLGAALRGRPALVIPARGPALWRESPAGLPFPQEVVFTFQGRLEEGGRIQGHCGLALRGDLELGYRQAFRQIPQQKWAEFLTQTSSPSGLGFTVSAVVPSASGQTEAPFALGWNLEGQNTTDWNLKRLLVPLMPIGLERAINAAVRPGDTIFLASPGVTYTARATLELPPAARPNLPPPLLLSAKAGTYRATYAFEKGILSVERTLVLRGGDIPPGERKSFSDFVQNLGNDENRYISFGEQDPDLSREDPATIALFNQGLEAQNRQDWYAAREAYRKVLERSPSFPGAHFNQGLTFLMKNDPQSGIRELLKEEALNPQLALPYLVLGKIYDRLGRKAEALAQWQLCLEKDPDNLEPADLALNLLQGEKRHREAAELLEKRLLRDPENVENLLSLADAYARTGQNLKVEAILGRAVRLSGTMETLSKSARILVDAGQNPAQAKTWAEQAGALLDAASLLLEDPERGSANTANMGATWTTLGRLNLQEGRPQEALRFLKASWNLGHTARTGVALAQTYERLGRKQEAADVYELAAVTGEADRNAIAQSFKKLTGRTLENGRGTFYVKGKPVSSPADHLVALRTATFTCPRASGTVRAVLVATSTGVERVLLLERAEDFPTQATAARQIRLRLDFPDAAPRRVFIPGGMEFAGTRGTFIALN